MVQGRPERPLEGGKPLVQLALTLRELRRDAGVTYRELALLAHYDHTVLCRAAGGLWLPTWAVTEAFALGCGLAMCRSVDLRSIRVYWDAADACREA